MLFKLIQLFYKRKTNKQTFAADISNSVPNSSNLILLYNLLTANKLCSITALSNNDDP